MCTVSSCVLCVINNVLRRSCNVLNIKESGYLLISNVLTTNSKFFDGSSRMRKLKSSVDEVDDSASFVAERLS